MRSTCAVSLLLLVAACGDSEPPVNESHPCYALRDFSFHAGCTEGDCDLAELRADTDITVREGGSGPLFQSDSEDRVGGEIGENSGLCSLSFSSESSEEIDGQIRKFNRSGDLFETNEGFGGSGVDTLIIVDERGQELSRCSQTFRVTETR